MKRNVMKDKKSISRFLLINSMVVIVLAVFIYYTTTLAGRLVIDNFVLMNLNWKDFGAENTYTYPFDHINTGSIEALGGWIEILDENKKVIFVKGKKQDNIYQYYENQLFDYSVMLHNDAEKYPCIYNIYPVEGPGGKPYLYIIKFPKTLYHTSIIANITSVISHPNGLHIIVYAAVAALYLLIFLVAMRFYSKFMARHIKTPLEYLMQGITEMEKQNYKFRMHFYAEKEFASIRDAFNKMAEKLEKIRDEKRALEESKHHMLAEISHDLKTPVTSILGFSRLLMDGSVSGSAENERYAGYIYKKSSYLAELIDELFQISKLDDDSFKFTFLKADIAEWLRRVVSESYPEFEKKGILLDIDISEAQIILEFDGTELKRAINNLLYNEIRYNPEKTTVQIKCYREVNKTVIRISDNGAGIPEEIRDSIFQPFVSGGKTKDSRVGTGLGLAITKRIIERHNGSISLRSDEDNKTIFTIELPII